jgi:hypothetical protein
MRALTGNEYRVERRGYKTPCHTWTRGKTKHGYAQITVNGRKRYVHRLKWEALHGRPVPEGCELDHLCRHRDCVNGEHVEPVTHTTNCRRGARTKLTKAQVCELRQRRGGGESPKLLAGEFGVAPCTVVNICAGRTWTDDD